MVEPIFVINMVGYEISDCLLSNSKHVIFKLGITLHTICESETSVIYVEIRNVSRIHYVWDQYPLHTRLSLENCLRYATLRKRLPHKNCVWWTAFATQFLLRTMCDELNNANDKIVNIVCHGNAITNDLTWKIVCDVPMNGNVFLGATVWLYIRMETFSRD